MELNFSTLKGKETAKRIIQKSQEGYYEVNQVIKPTDALMVLIKGEIIENLDNLCKKIENVYPQLKEIPNGAYRITQGEFDILPNIPSTIIKIAIYECAMECLKDVKEDEKNDPTKGHLGTKLTDDGKFNTSAWISHSLYEAALAEKLAKIMGVDSNKAKTLALLHDYGRKRDHSFTHVTKGFEELVELGLEDEAVAALTHSFLNGGRCANCDPAEKGFYLDKAGIPKWESDANKDDVTNFLEGYVYNIYDVILNVSDLMATDRGIVSPEDRIRDIRNRKPADPVNECYFLAELINKLSEILNRIGIKQEFPKANSRSDKEYLIGVFNKVSKLFYTAYKEREGEGQLH